MVKKSEYNYLFNLIAIAYADGDISENEMTFLRKKAVQLNISEELLESLINDAPSMRLIIPTHIAERLLYIEDCVEMTICDGFIHPKELQLCLTICERLNLPNSYLDDLLTVKEILIVKK
jgi:uncharacterized tellurite resistance protein B-like protein